MKVLLNDTSVLLNLLAADCLKPVSEAIQRQFAICPAVRDEVKKLRDPHTCEMVEVNVMPLIDAGLLQLLEISGEDEKSLYVQHSFFIDDGEAMSVAVAANRNLELSLDDRRAAMHIRRSFPELPLWSTPDLLKRWADRGSPTPQMLGSALRLIEIRARYFPPKAHPLASWWSETRQPSP